jgi:hypothetical protein
VQTLKLETDEAERTPDVGSGGPAAAEADANSTRGERWASGGRGGGDLQVWGAMGQQWPRRRRPPGGGSARERGVQRTCNEAAGRCGKASPAVGGGGAPADCSGGDGQTQSPGEEHDGSRIKFHFLFSLFLTVSIPEWQYVVIRSKDRDTGKYRFDPLRGSSGS